MAFRIGPTTKFALTSSKEGGQRYEQAVTKFSNGVKFAELTLTQEEGKLALNHLSDLAHRFGYLQLLTEVPLSMVALTHPGVSDR
jgi:hypothetical protein